MKRTTEELIEELNADLRARDPFETMKRQIRDRTIDEFLARLLTIREKGWRGAAVPAVEVWDMIAKAADRMKRS